MSDWPPPGVGRHNEEVTGLEVLLVMMSVAVCFVGSIATFVVVGEHHKALLFEAVGQRFRLLEQRSGNVDRPLGVGLMVRGAAVDVEAVLRGDHAVWHARTAVDGVGAGVVVVVDVDWKEAVRAARGLSLVEQLTPRFAVYADDAGRDVARALVDRRADVCAVVLEPVAAKALVVEGGAVFLELPRHGLQAADVEACVARVVAARDVVEGRAVVRGFVDVDVGAGAGSGNPCVVPRPRFA